MKVALIFNRYRVFFAGGVNLIQASLNEPIEGDEPNTFSVDIGGSVELVIPNDASVDLEEQGRFTYNHEGRNYMFIALTHAWP